MHTTPAWVVSRQATWWAAMSVWSFEETVCWHSCAPSAWATCASRGIPDEGASNVRTKLQTSVYPCTNLANKHQSRPHQTPDQRPSTRRHRRGQSSVHPITLSTDLFSVQKVKIYIQIDCHPFPEPECCPALESRWGTESQNFVEMGRERHVPCKVSEQTGLKPERCLWICSYWRLHPLIQIAWTGIPPSGFRALLDPLAANVDGLTTPADRTIALNKRANRTCQTADVQLKKV